MTDDHIEDQHRSPDPAKDPEPSLSSVEEATIQRLERSLADEQKRSAKLGATVEDLCFKAKILETSYATQLKDARLRAEAAEQQLAEAQAELERVIAQRGQPRRSCRSTDGSQADTIEQDHVELPPGDDLLTINELIEDSNRLRSPQETRHSNQHLEAQEEAVQETLCEEMIAPEAVFASESDDDELEHGVRHKRQV